MAYERLQARDGVSVVPSDTIGIPELSTLVASGAQDSTVSSELNDSTASFTTTVKKGDIVHDTTGGQIATVVSVDSDTALTLSADIFTGTESYVIYNKPAKGVALYVGVSGDLSVETVGGRTLLFTAHPVGYAPILVKRVNATGTAATNIVALF